MNRKAAAHVVKKIGRITFDMTESDFAFLKYHNQLNLFVKQIIDDLKDKKHITHSIALEGGHVNPTFRWNGTTVIPAKT